MSPIFRKCPVCGKDAVLKGTGPDFKAGYYLRTFKCKRGHVFSEKSMLGKNGDPEVEIEGD